MVKVVRPAWNLATGEDLRLETTSGGRLRMRDRWLQRYIDRVIATSTADAMVRRRLLSVMNMLSGPEALLHPLTLAGVVRHFSGWNRTPATLWSEFDPLTSNAASSVPVQRVSPSGATGREMATASRLR